SRFTAKHSAILRSLVDGGKSGEWERVFCSAFRSPGGSLTIALVNDAPVEFPLKLVLAHSHPEPGQSLSFYRYRYSEAQRNRADLEVNPEAQFSPATQSSHWDDSLPPNSLTIYSTLRLEHNAPGVIAE